MTMKFPRMISNKYMRENLLRFVLISLLMTTPFAVFAQQPALQPTPVEVKIDPKIFDVYVGQYEDKINLAGIVFSFFHEGDKFYGQVTNQDKFEIFPLSETKFFLKITRADVEFVRDSSGRAMSITWRQGGGTYDAKRIADKPAVDTRIPYKRSEAMLRS